MGQYIRVDVGGDGIAILTIDMQDKPMNVMTPAFNEEFSETIERVAVDRSIVGAVITSAKDSFFAGADLKWLLTEFRYDLAAAKVLEKHAAVNRFLRRLETCGKPFVAAINGTALGGGLEICLACHHRVASRNPKSRLGLPEVRVGLLPGGGGTQRLPRMVGVKTALKLLTTGRHLGPEEALKLGVVDQLVEPDELLEAARAWIRDVGASTQPWDEKGFRIPGGAGFESQDMANLYMVSTALVARDTKGNYPAPMAILSSVFEGTLVPIDAALRIESRYFTELMLNPVARNMTRTLFVNKQAADKLAHRPRGFEKTDVAGLGILGAGMMGAGIAYVSAAAGIECVLLDRTIEEAERGKDYSRKLTERGIERGRTTRRKADALLERIRPTVDYADLTRCDLVIEAVFEDRNIKRDVTQKTEEVIPDTAVFASNTSTLPITGLAETSKRPASFIGLHFFSPVDRMQLLEIIVGEKTSEETLARAMDYARKIRKTPIVVRDSRGFYTSRVFAVYVNEGMALLQDGVQPALIENAAVQAGMAVGPLAVTDEVTIELVYKVNKQASADLGKQYAAPSAIGVVHKMVEELDRPGKRYGKGFYEYPRNGKKFLWPGLADSYPPARQQPGVEEVKKRILYVQALDTFRCLDEGVLMRPEDCDIGAILGWGFPAWTGGPLSLIETVGLPEFVADCDRMASACGSRFSVPDRLRELAAAGKSIYPAPREIVREAA